VKKWIQYINKLNDCEKDGGAMPIMTTMLTKPRLYTW